MRYYSTTAGQMVLQAGISPSDTTITVDTTAGLPVTFPYTLMLDYATVSEEVVTVTAAAVLTLTVTRGEDGTVAQSHDFGAVIRHGVTARDHRESREHEAATAAHGVTGDLVGDTDTQTLDNKTFEPSADHVAMTVKAGAGNTEPTVEILNSSGTLVGSISELGFRTFRSGIGLASMLGEGGAALYTAAFTAAVKDNVHGLQGNVSGVPTARFLRLVNGITELFSVDHLGVVRSAGSIVTGTSSTSSNATVGGTLGVTGAITSPTITTLTAADAALDTRVDALETGDVVSTGTASLNFVAGVATCTHNLGYVPSVFVPSAQLGTTLVHLAWSSTVAATSTTAQVRCWASDGSPYAGTVSGVKWIASP